MGRGWSFLVGKLENRRNNTQGGEKDCNNPPKTEKQIAKKLAIRISRRGGTIRVISLEGGRVGAPKRSVTSLEKSRKQREIAGRRLQVIASKLGGGPNHDRPHMAGRASSLKRTQNTLLKDMKAQTQRQIRSRRGKNLERRGGSRLKPRNLAFLKIVTKALRRERVKKKPSGGRKSERRPRKSSIKIGMRRPAELWDDHPIQKEPGNLEDRKTGVQKRRKETSPRKSQLSRHQSPSEEEARPAASRKLT